MASIAMKLPELTQKVSRADRMLDDFDKRLDTGAGAGGGGGGGGGGGAGCGNSFIK